MKKEISFEERKQIQLNMLDEIDLFCRKNNIRYSIAFGTLLGAIRHKGFIPWDDDVDIMMPLQDLLKFKQLFVSDEIEYVDIDNDVYYDYAFSRISHKKTYRKYGLIYNGHGISIDIYVIISLPSNETEFWVEAESLFNKRIRLKHLRNKLVKMLPIKTIPGLNSIVRQYRDFLFSQSGDKETDRYYIIAGPMKIKSKMIYEKDIFHTVIDLQFENRTYKAIAEWDYFLTLRYGDYMQLPPEDQRKPYHNAHYYWK